MTPFTHRLNLNPKLNAPLAIYDTHTSAPLYFYMHKRKALS